MSLQQVHLRINDAATGQPTPVRVRVTDAVGQEYAPHGMSLDFPLGRAEEVGGRVMIGSQRWFYIDGACEIELPPGEITVEATKGPEYEPLHATTTLPAGKLALRFVIERRKCADPNWISGDTRAHFMSPHTALLEAAAEDLAVVNLLARESPFHSGDGQTYTTVPNLLAFSGQKPCLEAMRHLVAVNTLNVHPVLGKLALLHCHRVVHPLSFGGSDQADDWSLADWCGQCHRKKGLVVWVDAFESKSGQVGEALANLILGEIDAIEMKADSQERFRAWYQLLNAGLRVPLAGASGKVNNRMVLGRFRTYAFMREQQFSYTSWIEAVRQSRTYITSGPLLTLIVNGEVAGTIHRRAGGASSFHIRFAANSHGPIEKMELLVNGAVAARSDGEDVELKLDIPSGGWIAARCWSDGHIAAHTSPQYVEVQGVPSPVDPNSIEFLRSHLLRTREWVVNQGRFTKESSRERLLKTLDAAIQRLEARGASKG